MTKRLGTVIYVMRWILYPISIALCAALGVYVLAFLINSYHFFIYEFTLDMEVLMIKLLAFVDAAMVANLSIMIIQGSHQIFIHRFDASDERPQWLDHIDSGLLKVKIALSIAGITLVQILKDFVNIEKIEWSIEKRRISIHIVALLSALTMSWIWRITHPVEEKHEEPTSNTVHPNH